VPGARGRGEAGGARSPLRRQVVRCVLLAGGVITAWLLASGVASADEVAAMEDATAPGSSPLVDGGRSLDRTAGSGATLVRVAADVSAVTADGSAPPGQDRLPEPPAPSVEFGFAGGFGLPTPPRWVTAGSPSSPMWPTQPSLPVWPVLPELPGPVELPLPGLPAGHVRPIIPPGGDGVRPSSGTTVAAVPAVAADVAPRQMARISSAPVGLVAGARPTSAATPAPPNTPAPHNIPATPVAPTMPAQGLPCLPPSALPASPAPAVTGGTSSAATAVSADTAVAASAHERAPGHAPTSTWSIPDQPGTTPD
jgi:hypothetical protein